MKRRNFVKLALVAPIALYACKKKAPFVEFLDDSYKRFETLEVGGSYEEIGRAIGKRFEGNIRNMIARRGDWLPNLMKIAESESGERFAQSLLENAKRRFPYLVREVLGMSRGSGIDFKTMWALSIKSELSAFKIENPGCSTVFYRDAFNTWLFHNEDGDAAFDGEMFVLKATPPSGVTFTTLVYPGIIAGVGPSFNDRGVIQTTNFIGTRKPEIGVPRYFLGRAILEAKDLKDAVDIATSEPRAFPWHHNLASTESGKYVSVETLPDGRTTIHQPEDIYIHTNHAVGENTKNYEYEEEKYRAMSSIPRYESITEDAAAAGRPISDPKTILEWLSSRRNAPFSPCRLPEGDVSGKTLATAFFDVKAGKLRLYKGAPCEAIPVNRYVDYEI